MAKYVLLSLMTYFLMVCNQPAFGCEHKRYTGIEVGQSFSKSMHYEFSTGNQKKLYRPQMMNIYTGYRMGQYACFEFGGFTSASLNSSANAREGQAKLHGMHMGFVFMFPAIVKGFELVPGLGVTQLFSHVTPKNGAGFRDRGVVPRLVFGAQYQVSDQLKVRVSTSWHRLSSVCSDMVTQSHTLNLGIGLNFNFNEL